jgi:hypothetical protein
LEELRTISLEIAQPRRDEDFAAFDRKYWDETKARLERISSILEAAAKYVETPQ